MSASPTPSAEVFLDTLTRMLEEKLGWGSIADWKNTDYRNLSELIFEKTHRQLSPSTLKRTFGKVAYKGSHHDNTLNTLALFMGYPNWLSFKVWVTSQQQGNPTEPPPEALPGLTPLPRPDSVSRKFMPWPALLGFALFLLAFQLVINVFLWQGEGHRSDTSKSIPAPGKVVLDVVGGEHGKSAPARVKIDYYTEGLDTQAVNLIGFGDGQISFAQTASSGHGTKEHFYDQPGVYRIKFFSNRETKAMLPLLVRSQGWESRSDRRKDAAQGFHQFNPLHHLHASPEELQQARIDTTRKYFTYHYNYDHFDLSGDEMDLEVRLRNTSFFQSRAEFPKAGLIVRCEKEEFHVEIKDANALLESPFVKLADQFPTSEQRLAFAADLRSGIHLRLQNEKRRSRVEVDNRVLWETPIPEVGKILGFVLYFRGNGEVTSLRVRDTKSGRQYQEDFP